MLDRIAALWAARLANFRTWFGAPADEPPPAKLTPAEAAETFANLEPVSGEEPTMARKLKPGEQRIYRSAITGQIVSAEFARMHPDKTVSEIVRVSKAARRHK